MGEMSKSDVREEQKARIAGLREERFSFAVPDLAAVYIANRATANQEKISKLTQFFCAGKILRGMNVGDDVDRCGGWVLSNGFGDMIFAGLNPNACR